MYINNLVDGIQNLPYDEQQLLLKINQLILKSYNDKNKSFGRKEAIGMLKGILSDLQNSVGENTLGRSK